MHPMRASLRPAHAKPARLSRWIWTSPISRPIRRPCTEGLLLRLQSQNTEIIRDALGRCLPHFEQEQIDARLWIVKENRIRIRGGDERD